MISAFILIVGVLIFTALIGIKIYFTQKVPDWGEYVFGNAQLIGTKEVQSNYFSVLSNNSNSLFAIIVDGVLDKISGKYAAVLAVETFKHEYATNKHKRISFENFVTQALVKLNKNIEDHLYEQTVSLKFAIVLIENGMMHIAETPGNAVFLCRNREILRISGNKATKSLVSNPQIKISRLLSARNDVIMLASSGAVDSLTEMEILCRLSSQSHPQHKCQKLLQQSRQKHLKNQSNVTIIVAERTTRTAPAWDRDLES